MASFDVYAKCFRCDRTEYAGRANGVTLPSMWSSREVLPGWAPGALPVEALLCRPCVDVVDARMKRAWADALRPDPDPAPPS